MISIVIGKPGSGKSYHVVRYIYNTLCDFVRKGETERVIYTNVSVNIEAINKEISKEFKQEIHVDKYIQILENEELKYNPELVADEEKEVKKVAGKVFRSISPRSRAFFWNRFPDNALIIIDEIQKFLGSVKEDSESERQSLVEYFSLHRHKRHDWIFITQSLMSLIVEVRRVSEKVFEVFNAKSMTIPFPFNIPMRDIETLLVAFNYYRQVYRVRSGYLNGTYKVDYDDTVDVVVMEKRIFDLYQTHTLVKGHESAGLYVGDSVLPFKLGKGQRSRALIWFLEKHGLHLSLKLGVFVYVVVSILVYLNSHSKKASDISAVVPSADVQEIQDESSVVSPVEVVRRGIVSDSRENIVVTDEDVKQDLSDSTIIVNNRGVQLCGDWFELNEIVPDFGRLVQADSRRGCMYEAEDLLYLRFARDLDYYRRWLQDVAGSSSN